MYGSIIVPRNHRIDHRIECIVAFLRTSCADHSNTIIVSIIVPITNPKTLHFSEPFCISENLFFQKTKIVRKFHPVKVWSNRVR